MDEVGNAPATLESNGNATVIVEAVNLNATQGSESGEIIQETHHHLSPEALWTFMFIIFASQLLIFYWKKKHRKSFFMVTLAGLWIFPFYWCLQVQWWRFVIIWTVISGTLIYLVYRSSRVPMDGQTPRLIYKFFYSLYRITSFLSAFGYGLVVAEIFGFGLFLGIPLAPIGILMLTYGLYFGVLFRDWAEICTDMVTVSIGYYVKDGIPNRQCRYNRCGVCDQDLFADIRDPKAREKDKQMEKTYKMQCGHIVHEFCLRGWCIIGKKDTCPVCREKVSVSDIFHNHWHKQALGPTPRCDKIPGGLEPDHHFWRAFYHYPYRRPVDRGAHQ